MNAETLEERWSSYMAAYGAQAKDERERLLEPSVAEDVIFTNPAGDGKSRAGLGVHIANSQKGNPGAYFSTDKRYAQHDKLLYRNMVDVQAGRYQGRNGLQFRPPRSGRPIQLDGGIFLDQNLLWLANRRAWRHRTIAPIPTILPRGDSFSIQSASISFLRGFACSSIWCASYGLHQPNARVFRYCNGLNWRASSAPSQYLGAVRFCRPVPVHRCCGRRRRPGRRAGPASAARTQRYIRSAHRAESR